MRPSCPRATLGFFVMSTNPNQISSRLPLSLPLLMLTVLPGCFMNGVWNHLGAEEWQRTVVSQQIIPKTLTVRVNPDDYSMLLVDSGGPGVSSLEVHAQFWAQSAPALLVRPELFRVESAEISGQLAEMHGKTVRDFGRLIIKGTVVADGWRKVIDSGDVPADVLAQLHGNGLPNAHGFPPELRLCACFMASASLSLPALMPDVAADARVVSYVFVDRDGKMMLPDPAVTNGGQVKMRYPAVQAALQACTLYARVIDRNGAQLLRIDPDAFLVIQGLRPDRKVAGLAVHNSPWLIRPARESSATNSTSGPVMESTVSTNIFYGVVKPKETSGGTRALQVVLTPFALAADVVLSPVYLLMLLFGPVP